MEIQFQHANPYSGRESVVLRFDGLLPDQTVCVLVDAGQNVDVAELLDEDANEYLAAICLTHAHLDHYQSIGENLVHGAPVYAASETATMLGDVFAAGEDHYDLSNTDRVLDALEPVEEWTQIVPGLRVHPIPGAIRRGLRASSLRLLLMTSVGRSSSRGISQCGVWLATRASMSISRSMWTSSC